MRTKFADAAQHADAFFVICAISRIGGCYRGVGAESRSLEAIRSVGANKAPSRWKLGGLGAEPQALENFVFFWKNNLILGLLG